MKHTVRMLLVPEDVYRRMTTCGAPQSTMAASVVNAKLRAVATPIEHTARQMVKAADGRKLGMNDDERLIHYQQEFKRYQKLLEEQAERPLNVHLSERTTNALGDTVQKAAAASAAAAAATPMRRQRQQQQQRSTVTPKRRTPQQQGSTATGNKQQQTDLSVSTEKSSSSSDEVQQPAAANVDLRKVKTRIGSVYLASLNSLNYLNIFK